MNNNEWTDEIENFIIGIRNLCNERYKMHEKESDRCYKWYFWINIILIFSGGFTTIISLFGLIWNTYTIQLFTTISTMMLGIIIIISTSINKFCRFESRINDNIKVSIDYEKKRLEIDLELSKDYKNRKSANNYQLYIKTLYINLVKYSPYISEKYRNKYKLDNILNKKKIHIVNRIEEKNENRFKKINNNAYNNWQMEKFLNQ